MIDKVTGSVTETASVGFLDRLMKSVGSVVLGIGLFFGSFALLWWNEGNVVAEKAALDEMKKAVVKADAQAPNKSHQGKLVHASARLDSTEKLGDAPYLAPGAYLALDRQVEMFQWVEKTSSKTKKNTGGSETTETTYSYKQEWATGVEDSSKFKNPTGHQNPASTLDGKSQKVTKASFGKMDGTEVLERLSATEKLVVTPALLAPKQKHELKNGMVYLRKKPGSTADSIGDMRISYRVLKAGPFSVIAKQGGKSLEPYLAKNGKEKFLVESGKKTPAAMIQSAKNAEATFAMIMRVVGFIVMFIGLNLMAGPLTTLLDFIPMLGKIGRFGLGAIFFVVAGVLSAVTIVVAMIAHNPIALAVVLVALAGGGFLLYQKKKSSPAARGLASPVAQQKPGSKLAA